MRKQLTPEEQEARRLRKKQQQKEAHARWWAGPKGQAYKLKRKVKAALEG